MMKQALAILLVGGIALGALPAAQAFAPSALPKTPASDAVVHYAADSGISIVRMPPRQPGGSPSTTPVAVQEPPTSSKTPPAQPQGRLVTLPARAGSQATDPQKGWIGVNMEAVELPLALSLGLPNADGVLLLGTTPGGPADQAKLRFGDVVVGLNGRV